MTVSIHWYHRSTMFLRASVTPDTKKTVRDQKPSWKTCGAWIRTGQVFHIDSLVCLHMEKMQDCTLVIYSELTPYNPVLDRQWNTPTDDPPANNSISHRKHLMTPPQGFSNELIHGALEERRLVHWVSNNQHPTHRASLSPHRKSTPRHLRSGVKRNPKSSHKEGGYLDSPQQSSRPLSIFCGKTFETM